MSTYYPLSISPVSPASDEVSKSLNCPANSRSTSRASSCDDIDPGSDLTPPSSARPRSASPTSSTSDERRGPSPANSRSPTGSSSPPALAALYSQYKYSQYLSQYASRAAGHSPMVAYNDFNTINNYLSQAAYARGEDVLGRSASRDHGPSMRHRLFLERDSDVGGKTLTGLSIGSQQSTSPVSTSSESPSAAHQHQVALAIEAAAAAAAGGAPATMNGTSGSRSPLPHCLHAHGEWI